MRIGRLCLWVYFFEVSSMVEVLFESGVEFVVVIVLLGLLNIGFSFVSFLMEVLGFRFWFWCNLRYGVMRLLKNLCFQVVVRFWWLVMVSLFCVFWLIC